jgi:hypothetical protein
MISYILRHKLEHNKFLFIFYEYNPEKFPDYELLEEQYD